MKKILLAVIIMLTACVAAYARDRYAHDASVLPPAAQNFLKTYFNKADVSIVKIDKELGRVSEYEVILDNGSEVTFDRSGNWKEVEMSKSASVPKGIVPESIAGYVKANHKNAHVVGVEKNNHGYEVELSDGIEIKFDLNGKFKRYDR